MVIDDLMDLGDLAERMGGGAMQAHAERMRDLLVSMYDGEEIGDVPEEEWEALLGEAMDD